MNANDPNISIVEMVADAIGPLRNELVLVGGCSVGFLITDQARPSVRHTVDVDLVAEVTSLGDYYNSLLPRLAAQGFTQSPEGEHMCRWKRGPLILDVMPSDAKVLGHSSNRWYPEAVRSAQPLRLPSGVEMLIVSPPLFVATKLVAFHGRGKGDFDHHDMEDIINVVDGRPELGNEVARASSEAKAFLRREFEELVLDDLFIEKLPRHFRPDPHDQSRVPIVIARMLGLAGL